MICGVFYKSSALFQGLVWCQGPAEGLSSGFTFITAIRAGSFTAFPLSGQTISLVKQTESNMLDCHNRLEEEPWQRFHWNVHFPAGCSVLFGSWSARRPQQSDQRNTWVISAHHWEQIGSFNGGFPWNYIRAIQYFHPEMMKDDVCSTNACTLSSKHLLKPLCGQLKPLVEFAAEFLEFFVIKRH